MPKAKTPVTAVCQNPKCGKKFEAKTRRAKYCSQACRQAAYTVRQGPTDDELTRELADLTSVALGLVRRLAATGQSSTGVDHTAAAKAARAAVEALTTWADAVRAPASAVPLVPTVPESAIPAARCVTEPVVTQPELPTPPEPSEPEPVEEPPPPQEWEPEPEAVPSRRTVPQRRSGGLTPTAEQEAILDACSTGQTVVIEAGAGTGKTSTLKMAAAVMRGRGLYVAFNRTIAGDAAASFPGHVTCKTAHSLAFAAVGRAYKRDGRLGGPRQRAEDIAQILGIREPLALASGSVLASAQVARLALGMVKKFTFSADDVLGTHHMAKVHLPGEDEKAAQAELADALLPYARRAWEDITSPHGRLKVEHDHYLKIWALTRPSLRADFVYLDEAQDSNPVVARLVQEQSAQVIVVGDSNQAIYGWRGAVDALANWPAQRRLRLTQSWRFGRMVAYEANKWLTVLRSDLRLTGAPSLDTAVAPLELPDVDAVLCRTNAEAVRQGMEALAAGRRPGLVGGTKDIATMAQAALDLQNGKRTDHPELLAFESWDQVKDYVEHDDAGADLAVFVRLVDTYGAQALISTTKQFVDPDKADLVISTAHRAKGREWSHVRIADDFREPKRDPKTGELGTIPREDAMLAYVAVTRARTCLDRRGLAWIDPYVDSPPQGPVAPFRRTLDMLKNLYPGTCQTCGTRVPRDRGRVRKNGRSWITYCQPCVNAGSAS